mmetsp:Transcript_47685/g.123642  ORF Transcript_47685/g.123642 Transcript_47685/m.123642 type:complete len:571 (-) Transcript_47685:475-2187(-)
MASQLQRGGGNGGTSVVKEGRALQPQLYYVFTFQVRNKIAQWQEKTVVFDFQRRLMLRVSPEGDVKEFPFAMLEASDIPQLVRDRSSRASISPSGGGGFGGLAVPPYSFTLRFKPESGLKAYNCSAFCHFDKLILLQIVGAILTRKEAIYLHQNETPRRFHRAGEVDLQVNDGQRTRAIGILADGRMIFFKDTSSYVPTASISLAHARIEAVKDLSVHILLPVRTYKLHFVSSHERMDWYENMLEARRASPSLGSPLSLDDDHFSLRFREQGEMEAPSRELARDCTDVHLHFLVRKRNKGERVQDRIMWFDLKRQVMENHFQGITRRVFPFDSISSAEILNDRKDDDEGAPFVIHFTVHPSYRCYAQTSFEREMIVSLVRCIAKKEPPVQDLFLGDIVRRSYVETKIVTGVWEERYMLLVRSPLSSRLFLFEDEKSLRPLEALSLSKASSKEMPQVGSTGFVVTTQSGSLALRARSIEMKNLWVNMIQEAATEDVEDLTKGEEAEKSKKSSSQNRSSPLNREGEVHNVQSVQGSNRSMSIAARHSLPRSHKLASGRSATIALHRQKSEKD